MTRVLFERGQDGSWKSFSLDGHTGYAEEGTDIVCAALSVLAINTVNCLEELLQEKILVETDNRDDGARLTCVFPERPSEEASLLVDCLLVGVRDTYRQYGSEFVNFEIREA